MHTYMCIHIACWCTVKPSLNTLGNINSDDTGPWQVRELRWRATYMYLHRRFILFVWEKMCPIRLMGSHKYMWEESQMERTLCSLLHETVKWLNSNLVKPLQTYCYTDWLLFTPFSSAFTSLPVGDKRIENLVFWLKYSNHPLASWLLSCPLNPLEAVRTFWSFTMVVEAHSSNNNDSVPLFSYCLNKLNNHGREGVMDWTYLNGQFGLQVASLSNFPQAI